MNPNFSKKNNKNELKAQSKKKRKDAFLYLYRSFPVIIPEKFVYKEIPKVFSPSECQQLIQLGISKLTPSMTISSNNKSGGRQSSGTWLENEKPIVQLFNQKLHSLVQEHCQTKLGVENGEELYLIQYQPDQYYNPHYDAAHPQNKQEKNHKQDNINDLKKMGSYRYISMITYLNDNFEGGQTEFPYLNVKINPQMGKVLFFFSLKPNYDLLLESYHAGLPVTLGTKYICSKWYRLCPIKTE